MVLGGGCWVCLSAALVTGFLESLARSQVLFPVGPDGESQFYLALIWLQTPPSSLRSRDSSDPPNHHMPLTVALNVPVFTPQGGCGLLLGVQSSFHTPRIHVIF